MSDWYRVPRKVFLQQEGAHGLLQHYNSSIVDLLNTVYPEYPWVASEFVQSGPLPRGWWKDVQNQREFLERIGPKLGVKQVSFKHRSAKGVAKSSLKLSDWYGVARHQVEKQGGGGLFVAGGYSSLYEALKAVYPEHDWVLSRFVGINRVEAGYWTDPNNHRAFLDRLATKLHIKEVFIYIISF